MRWSSLFAIVLTAWGMISARPARADEPVAPAPPAPTRAVRLVLWLSPADGAGPLAPERLRAGLAAELQRPIVADGAAATDLLTITWVAAWHELTVSYQPEGGAPVARTVTAPEGEADVAALALVLAGNVARDQTSELLAPRRPRRAAAVPVAAPPVSPLPSSEVAPPLERADVAPPTTGADASIVRTTGADADSSGLRDLLDRLRFQFVAWSASRSLFNVALRASDQLTYAQLGFSAHDEAGRSMIGPGLTVGTRIPLGRFACESDAGVTYLHGTDELPGQTVGGYTNNRLITRVRSALVFHPGRDVGLFAGIGYALTTHFYHSPDSEWGPELFGGVQL